MLEVGAGGVGVDVVVDDVVVVLVNALTVMTMVLMRPSELPVTRTGLKNAVVGPEIVMEDQSPNVFATERTLSVWSQPHRRT